MHDQAMPSVAKHDYSSPNNVIRYQPMPRNGRRDHSMPSKTDQRQSRPMPSTINQCQARDFNASPLTSTPDQCHARPSNAKHDQPIPSNARHGPPVDHHLGGWPTNGIFSWGAGPQATPLGVDGLLTYFPWRKESQERMVRNWTAPGVEGPPVDLLV